MAGFEFLRAESLHRHADVLLFPARIREAQVDEFNVLIFDSLEYFFWSHGFFLLIGFSWRSKSKSAFGRTGIILDQAQIKKALDPIFGSKTSSSVRTPSCRMPL